MVSKTISLLLAGSILFTSCVSHTMIVSEPSEAKVYVNGMRVGTTPYKHSDKKSIGSKTHLRLEKEGYEPLNTTFIRAEMLDARVFFGAIFIVPLFWFLKYKPMHAYTLKPKLGNEQETIKETPKPNLTKSKADRLRELKHLLDEKILTQEEYEKEKKKILEEDEK